MGLMDRESMATSALTHGGITIKNSPLTIAFICLAIAAWALAAMTSTQAEIGLVVAVVGAAITTSLAAMASVCVKVVGAMLDTHAARGEAATHALAGRVEVATRSHSSEMKSQVISLNWLATSQAWAQERANLEAGHLYGPRGSSDTGPFTKINGG